MAGAEPVILSKYTAGQSVPLEKLAEFSGADAAGTAVYVALQAIDWLSLIWGPILPHSSEQIHSLLGYDQPLFGRQFTEEVNDARGSHLVLRYDHAPASGVWTPGLLPPGQALRTPAPLFTKLDPDLMAEKLGSTA